MEGYEDVYEEYEFTDDWNFKYEADARRAEELEVAAKRARSLRNLCTMQACEAIRTRYCTDYEISSEVKIVLDSGREMGLSEAMSFLNSVAYLPPEMTQCLPTVSQVAWGADVTSASAWLCYQLNYKRHSSVPDFGLSLEDEEEYLEMMAFPETFEEIVALPSTLPAELVTDTKLCEVVLETEVIANELSLPRDISLQRVLLQIRLTQDQLRSLSVSGLVSYLHQHPEQLEWIVQVCANSAIPWRIDKLGVISEYDVRTGRMVVTTSLFSFYNTIRIEENSEYEIWDVLGCGDLDYRSLVEFYPYRLVCTQTYRKWSQKLRLLRRNAGVGIVFDRLLGTPISSAAILQRVRLKSAIELDDRGRCLMHRIVECTTCPLIDKDVDSGLYHPGVWEARIAQIVGLRAFRDVRGCRHRTLIEMCVRILRLSPRRRYDPKMYLRLFGVRSIQPFLMRLIRVVLVRSLVILLSDYDFRNRNRVYDLPLMGFSFRLDYEQFT